MAQYALDQIQKRSYVYVSGELRTRSWEGQGGEKRYATEVIASEFEVVRNPKPRAGSGQQDQKSSNIPDGVPRDDVPAYNDS